MYAAPRRTAIAAPLLSKFRRVIITDSFHPFSERAPISRTCRHAVRAPSGGSPGGSHQRLSFRTQAGCASNSSGNSGSSVVTAPAPDLKRSGAANPSRVTDFGFAPSNFFTVNCLPGQRGRIA